MRKVRSSALLRLAPSSPSLSVLSLHAQTPSPNVQRFISVDDPVVALTHVRVVDGTGAEPAEDQTVVISEGRISAWHLPDPPKVPAAPR